MTYYSFHPSEFPFEHLHKKWNQYNSKRFPNKTTVPIAYNYSIFILQTSHVEALLCTESFCFLMLNNTYPTWLRSFIQTPWKNSIHDSRGTNLPVERQKYLFSRIPQRIFDSAIAANHVTFWKTWFSLMTLYCLPLEILCQVALTVQREIYKICSSTSKSMQASKLLKINILHQHTFYLNLFSSRNRVLQASLPTDVQESPQNAWNHFKLDL